MCSTFPLAQGLTNDGLWSKSSSPVLFCTYVVLEHSDAHSLTHCLWLLFALQWLSWVQVQLLQRLYDLESPNYLLSSPLQKKKKKKADVWASWTYRKNTTVITLLLRLSTNSVVAVISGLVSTDLFFSLHRDFYFSAFLHAFFKKNLLNARYR